MLAALRERGIRPDVIVGTSVGALNGAWLAGHPDAPIDDLAEVWKATAPLRRLPGRSPARPARVRRPAPQLVRRRPAAHVDRAPRDLRPARGRADPVARRRGRGAHRSRRAVVDGAGGRVGARERGAARRSSIPSRSTASPYMDGGVGNNTPISHTVALGVDQVWVLCAGHACALTEPPTSALAMALHALSLLLHRQLASTSSATNRWSSCACSRRCARSPSRRSTSRTPRSSSTARTTASTRWLDEEHPPVGQARFLGAHDHPA